MATSNDPARQNFYSFSFEELVGKCVAFSRGIAFLESENARLKEEAERLQQDDACKEWSYANELKEEIAHLQSLLAWHKVEDGVPEPDELVQLCHPVIKEGLPVGYEFDMLRLLVNNQGKEIKMEWGLDWCKSYELTYFPYWRRIEPPQEEKEKG